MTINWNTIWMDLFGKTELFGINIGFQAAITVTGFIVILMNVVFQTRKGFHSYGDSLQLLNPLENSSLIHKTIRFDSKGGRIPNVISDNYGKLTPFTDTRLRASRSGIQQKVIMKFLHI